MNSNNDNFNAFDAYLKIIDESTGNYFDDMTENVQRSIVIKDIKVDIAPNPGNPAIKEALEGITKILRQGSSAKSMSLKTYINNVLNHESELADQCNTLSQNLPSRLSRGEEEPATPSATPPVSGDTHTEKTA